MELHHSKHHATYVKGVNTALEKLAEASARTPSTRSSGWRRTCRLDLGGHINHSVFWPNLSPDGGDKPDGAWAAIDEFFGSFDKFRAQFEATANAIQGSGWSMLVYDILGSRLNIVQLYDQQANLPLAEIPILILDMWETRVLSGLQERQGRLRQSLVERGQLGRRSGRFAAAKSQTAGLIAPY